MFSEKDIENIIKREEAKNIVESNIKDKTIGKIFLKNHTGLGFLDSKYGLSLWLKGDPDMILFVSGVSYGLDKYYENLLPEGIGICPEDLIQKEVDTYQTLIGLIKNKPIITHMQATNGNHLERKSIKWKHIFVNLWETLAKESGEEKLYYLPAEFNYWNSDMIRYSEGIGAITIPEVEKLKINYDYPAKKQFKYTPNPDLMGIFEKSLN